ELIKIAVKKGRSVKPNLKIGICGEHGGDPHTINFCNGSMLDYVSCSPFRLPIARLAAAQAALNPGKAKNKMTSKNKLKNSKSKTQNNSSDKPFSRDDKHVAVITALEAKDYLGKVVTVKGFVADIYKSEKVAYLNFVEKYPENPFTAVIFANKFADFGDV